MKLFTKNGRFLRKMWKQDSLGIVFSYINKSNISKKRQFNNRLSCLSSGKGFEFEELVIYLQVVIFCCYPLKATQLVSNPGPF